ncbi:MAG: AbrB/MazE/SpoVT family DNA-binding domain-containing protein [Ruminococcus sp.]|nr:AbrB/MazE/SpoVT family DNA-binding domain-containing protein [Ruminococcus sp.]
MKAAGYLVRVDELGRIVIPVRVRRALDFDKGACLELFTEDNTLVIRKYGSCCTFCHSDEELTEHMDKFICASCLQKLMAK